MKKIKTYIFGCSGIAKSIIDTFKRNDCDTERYLTIVDKDPSLAKKNYYRDVPAISMKNFESIVRNNENFIIAFFKPENILNRLEFAKYLTSKFGLLPTTFVDKNAIISPSAVIRKGCYIGPNVIVDSDAVIGENTTILFNSVISRECYIAENNFISANVVVKGGVSIGQSNFISASCNVLKNLGTCNFLNAGVRYADKDINSRIIFYPSEKKEIIISNNASAALRQLRFLS